MSECGCLWWAADDVDELGEVLSSITRSGEVSVKRVDRVGTVIYYQFELPKEKAKEILGYEPDEEEWLVEEDG